MDSQIAHPAIKACTALGLAISIDWLTTVGQFCAALTAVVLFGELVWKKAVNPLIAYLKDPK